MNNETLAIIIWGIGIVFGSIIILIHQRRNKMGFYKTKTEEKVIDKSKEYEQLILQMPEIEYRIMMFVTLQNIEQKLEEIKKLAQG